MKWVFVHIVPRVGLSPEDCIGLGRGIQSAIAVVGGVEYAPGAPGAPSSLDELLLGEMPLPHSLRIARDVRQLRDSPVPGQDIVDTVRKFHAEHGSLGDQVDKPYVAIHLGSEDIEATVAQIASMLPNGSVGEIKLFHAPAMK